MRAIKIDSENRTITEIEISGDLDSMREVVDGTICLVFSYPNKNNECFVNDDGLLNNPQHFFASRFYHAPLAGNGLLVGSNAEGDTTPCTLPLDFVIESTKFFTLSEVQAFIRAGIIEYSTYITPMGGEREKVATIDLGAFDNKKE